MAAPVAGLPRILVRLPNWLGDAMLARPALHGLRAGRPEAEMLGVGPGAIAGLLAADGAVHRGEAWPADRRPRAEVLARIREFAPQAALVLPGSFSSALLAWRSGARLRVGFRGEGRSLLLTHALPRAERGERHLSDEYLTLGRLLGARETALPPLQATAAGRAALAAALERHRIPAGARRAVLGPCSAFGPAREWFPERFAEVGRALAGRGLRVLVCGTADERGRCQAVARAIGPGAACLAGETDLQALVAVCRGAALAVCNDSGLAHLAAAAGTPTIQIYGSASSAWTAALGPRARVVQRPPVCSPCYQRTCRIGYRCLDAVGVSEVLRLCDELAA